MDGWWVIIVSVAIPLSLIIPVVVRARKEQ